MGPKKIDIRGQTALILILVTAAALIFLAITLNWGRIAQSKVLLSVSADEAASLLASDAASYGEMEKQTYLNDTNQVTASTGIILAIVMVVIVIIITIVTWGSGTTPALILLGEVLSVLAVVMAVVNLILQVAVVQPGITSLWNKLQRGQPIPQQFFEGGLAAALEGAVTDQVKITDYLDWNSNGIYGNNPGGFPNDTVSRFAVYYTDRLRMINQAAIPLIPQVVFFSDQLGEFMNGETCVQNANDNKTYSIPIAPACSTLNCLISPIDPLCQIKIPDNFQLSDSCVASDPTLASYNPYCDPCCQPLVVPGSNPPIPLRPSSCSTDVSAYGAPVECLTNNPYGGASSQRTLLYDSSFQNYGAGISFLAQFGRDQQMGPFTTDITPQGSSVNETFFPNGLYPFFWLMNYYSPQVDNIATVPWQQSQYHWCVAGSTLAGITIPAVTPPAGYPILNQLVLPYTCIGQDCCVNYLAGSVAGGVPTPSAINWTIDTVGDLGFGKNPAQDPSFGESGTGTWLPGDNQMCLANWEYNGSSPTGSPDGTCEWTGTATPPTASPSPGMSVDRLDDTMHTLSDFAVFANTLLNKDVATLSSTFQGWYPQAAQWLDPNNDLCDDGTSCPSGGLCDDGTTCNYMQPGRLLSIYDPYSPYSPAAPLDLLNQWNAVITNWLNTVYTSPSAMSPVNAWCVPPEATVLAGNSSTNEDTYINANGGTGPWGDLHHVISCLNYNAGYVATQTPLNGNYTYTQPSIGNNGPVYNYNQCVQWLASPSCIPVCANGSACGSGGPGFCSNHSVCPPPLTGTPCDPATLGRSLAGPVPVYDGCTGGSFATWANNGYTLANAEAPKFLLRSAFLTDIYTRATNMQTIFHQGDNALTAFLAPCSGVNCSTGGPAAQLAFAYSQPSPTTSLSNSVIYGWMDNLPSGGSGGCLAVDGITRVGCAHIVQATVYSVGRCGALCGSTVYPVNSVMPWVQTKTFGFLGMNRSYTLVQRDGNVYVSVKRWDEDHGSILFPNTHLLWQMLFHNPNGGSASPGLGSGFGADCTLPSPPGGYIGLVPNTNNGLGFSGISPQDQLSLSNAFMLNGSIDPNLALESTCVNLANLLLSTAPESHACARYVASINANHDPSGTGSSDTDYSLKFIKCPSGI